MPSAIALPSLRRKSQIQIRKSKIPMIPRYTRPEMGRIWTDENKFQKWLDVEIATAEVEAEAGLIPKSAARAIRKKARFEVERILEIERQVKHDVIAFTTNVAEHVGREGRYLHYGLTSNDVVDTAQALLVREASALLTGGAEPPGRSSEATRLGVSAYAHDRPHPRHSRGAHHLRLQARPLVCGEPAQHGEAGLRRRADARRQDFRRRGHLHPSAARD